MKKSPRMLFLNDDLVSILGSFYKGRNPDCRFEFGVSKPELAVLERGKSITVDLLPDRFHQKGRPAKQVKAVCVVSQFEQEPDVDFIEAVAFVIDGVTIGTVPSTRA